MAEKPLLSAIILNYRSPQFTVRCVQNLRQQTIADRMEIIVVDNASQDDSIGVLRNRLREYANVRIVETPENLGFGGGNNYGEKFARGEYLLILNPDTDPPPDGLERLIALLKADPTIGIIAPALVFPDGAVRESCRSFPRVSDVIAKRTPLGTMFPHLLTRYLQRAEARTGMRDVDWMVGAFLLMERALYGELGGFDERYFLFFEDTDLCRRCWERGKRVVYCADMRAADREQRLSGQGIFPILTTHVGRTHLRSAVKYFWKWWKHPLPRRAS